MAHCCRCGTTAEFKLRIWAGNSSSDTAVLTTMLAPAHTRSWDCPIGPMLTSHDAEKNEKNTKKILFVVVLPIFVESSAVLTSQTISFSHLLAVGSTHHPYKHGACTHESMRDSFSASSFFAILTAFTIIV